MNRKSRIVATLLGLGCLVSATSILAAPLTFTIDPTRSSLKASLATTTGVTFTAAQGPGSDTASLSGTVNTDLVPGTSIQFLTTSNTNPALYTGTVPFIGVPGLVAPAVGGAFPGAAPGQFGLLALIPGVLGGPGPGGTGLIGVRGVVSDQTSPALPLAGGAFVATGVTIANVAGTADVNTTILGTPVIATLSEVGSAPDLNPAGMLVETPTLDTLTLPILTHTLINAGSGVVLVAVEMGTIVATAVPNPIPEPSTFVLAGFALAGLALCVRRKFQRN
jgi:hypothetical protein